MFKSGNEWTENQQNVYTISDFDAETVESMIHFIYCNKIPDNKKYSARYKTNKISVTKGRTADLFGIQIIRFSGLQILDGSVAI